MQLWTDYEGLTIDGAYPLKQLLLPEGRSAFFSTANGKGEPLVLRLIECHFDQEEILARWRCLEALNHPAMLKLEHFGPIDLDGGPAVYAVFEKVDANLSDALDRGHLSVKETSQIADCLFSALEMLHNHGFVHEHVEARNLFAVGETVKLRSDCIREAREGEEGRAAKRRDVHDAAVVLLQTLTQRTTLQGVPETAIPTPFGEMIRNGMSGTWGVAEMRGALEGFKPAGVRPKPAPAAAAPASAASAANPAAAAKPQKPAAPTPEGPQLHLKFAAKEKEEAAWGGNPVRSAVRQQVFRRLRADRDLLRSRWVAPVAAVAMLVLAVLLFAHAWHTRSAHPARAAAHGSAIHAAARRAPAGVRAARIPTHAAKVAKPSAKGARTEWRVILYTYDHQDAAQKMVTKVAERHPELTPQVFSPKGHAPYLVAIGGVMSRQQAYALAHRARGLGLARDAYAQNF
ncbi:MAG: SPOR domain-containing protein [Acidobacteriota bacterium]